MRVRAAQQSDVSAMVRLIEQRRIEYERVQPVFWRKPAHSARFTLWFYRVLLWKRKTTALVVEDHAQVVGFVIARQISVPPVYNPGRVTMLVDDFCVCSPDR